MRHGYHNIEYRKLAWDKPFYVGYSNLGTVRISGGNGAWSINMGQSTDLQGKGINGAYVTRCATLSDVSKCIEDLRIVVRPSDHHKQVLARKTRTPSEYIEYADYMAV